MTAQGEREREKQDNSSLEERVKAHQKELSVLANAVGITRSKIVLGPTSVVHSLRCVCESSGR